MALNPILLQDRRDHPLARRTSVTHSDPQNVGRALPDAAVCLLCVLVRELYNHITEC